MTDILIRDVPEDVVTALDERTRQAGLSRAEYLRRLLVQDTQRAVATVTVDDLRRFSETFADLRDPEIMASAWD